MDKSELEKPVSSERHDVDYDVYEDDNDDFDVSPYHHAGHEPESWKEHDPDHELKRSFHPDKEHHKKGKGHSQPVLQPAAANAYTSMGHRLPSGRHTPLRSQRAKDPRYQEGLQDLAGLM
ncbi:unnamed protein product [Schistocephalus solidus]|uniref:Intraflagellar transport protein 46 homolog n=1 Tax=Schistocephalus solidus TaxID=70667 RepID=A0A183TE24_SCHSO|nr:unnamed protein product [Schistocephalus solidus]